MHTLSLRHACQLNEALAALYVQPDPATLFNQLAAALLSLFGAEAVCFDLWSTTGEVRFLGASPQHLFTVELLNEAAPLVAQHPLFTELARLSPVPLRTSDFVTVPQFVRTDLYHHLYRGLALTHHLILAAPVAGQGLITCALFRHRRDFSEAERTLLAFVRPHIEALMRLSGRATDRPAPDTSPAYLDLTPREAEVLHHLTLGRTDKEIGHWCRISPRTVQNHLQRIYTKLGVDNRTAASLRAVAGS